MRVASELHDSRINAQNILVEMTIAEYESLVKEVLEENVLQRRRVGSSKTVYALLKEDLIKQCVIPPIVLALTNKVDFNFTDAEAFQTTLMQNRNHLVILDGLQRTYTINDLLSELRLKDDAATLQAVQDAKLRVEIYVGLNRLGILYRMLTLNTGQTPMSLRHQIEMIYHDYLSKEIEGIELIREADDKPATKPNQYNFKQVIEGFNAYLDRDELPIDKADVLENIASLEKLAKEDPYSELFEKYLVAVNNTVQTFYNLCGETEVSEQFIIELGAPFGKNVLQIFKKPQAISGFGAAIGKLIDLKALESIDEVNHVLSKIVIDDPVAFIEEVNRALLWLKMNSKKIGNAQRSFFTFYFRELLHADSDSYILPLQASKSALRKYQALNM